MQPVEKINGKFIIYPEKELGSGAFGRVCEGKEILTGAKVAIKEINIEKLKK